MIERRNFLKKPPYTKAMSDEELQKISIAPLKINISSNSVLTERMIRTVDQVAEKSTSPKMRDGMVWSINEDRKAKPKLEKKEDLIKKWFFHEMIDYLKLGLKNQKTLTLIIIFKSNLVEWHFYSIHVHRKHNFLFFFKRTFQDLQSEMLRNFLAQIF